MDYKAGIIESLDRLEKLGGNRAEIAALRKQVKTVSDQGTLFKMYQTMREVIAAESGGGDTSFDFQLPDGTVRKAKNMQDAQDQIWAFKKATPAQKA